MPRKRSAQENILIKHGLLINLRAIFEYDHSTGEIFWNVNRGFRIRKGDKAGSLGRSGHRIVYYDGLPLYASHIAWALLHGEWPKSRVFTLNGNPDDLRADNLSEQRRHQRKDSPFRDAEGRHREPDLLDWLNIWRHGGMRSQDRDMLVPDHLLSAVKKLDELLS